MKEIKYIEDILMRLDDATSNIATSRNNPDESGFDFSYIELLLNKLKLTQMMNLILLSP